MPARKESARKPRVKRAPKVKDGAATAQVPAGQETGTTEVRRERSSDSVNR